MTLFFFFFFLLFAFISVHSRFSSPLFSAAFFLLPFLIFLNNLL